MSFESQIEDRGVAEFPLFSGTRVLLMPFVIHDPETSLPNSLAHYRALVARLCALVPSERGVGYVTIDEALVRTGETHRRPGIHVDGVGADGSQAAWGGGGGAWSGCGGMLLASPHSGCRGWRQVFDGDPGLDGDCAHLAAECRDDAVVDMLPNRAYWCNSLAVHEALPVREDVRRQFIRVSTPSRAPWYLGCTPNPLGIQPTGPILPMREAHLAYRSQA